MSSFISLCPFTAVKIPAHNYIHLMYAGAEPEASGSRGLLLRLYSPCNDEHTTPQHAEHLPLILQRDPLLLRWLEKAKQSLLAVDEPQRCLTSVQMEHTDSTNTTVVVLMLQSLLLSYTFNFDEQT